MGVQIRDCASWQDWYKILEVQKPTPTALYRILLKAVKYATNTPGYHFQNPERGNGWEQVLDKYKPGWRPAVPPSSQNLGFQGRRHGARPNYGNVAHPPKQQSYCNNFKWVFLVFVVGVATICLAYFTQFK